MGFAENFEVLQIGQRLLAWSNPDIPTTNDLRKRNLSLRAVVREI
jgi:hypothetical protein